MDKISSIRGMPDVFESDTNYLAELNETLSRIFLSHNLNEVNTPILEQTELFIRSTGITSDIVNKEIYSFNDRNEQSLSLRPEGTAGVVRSVIQRNLIVLNINFGIRVLCLDMKDLKRVDSGSSTRQELNCLDLKRALQI